jgi:predicted ribosome quality control (RQC) complex YloA/Tae2 family protein
MPKKSISSVELTAIVNELQILVKGKVSQIYHQEKKEMLFQLHAVGKGKQLLKVIPGKYLCLTTQKNAPQRPTGFCMLLRKYIGNAFIKSVIQYESQRILVFELEKQEKYCLIIELFSKGNVVLTDVTSTIIGTLTWQKWKDRTVKPGEKYVYPTSVINWKTITGKEFASLMKESDKKNVATTLATELGLGGVYAEELCILADVDKDLLAPELTGEQIHILFEAHQSLLKKLESPAGYIYENNITPFPLQGKVAKEETPLYSDALDTINPFETVSPYEQKINTIKNTIKNQENALGELQQKIDDNTTKAELIYEQYMPLQKMVDIVTAMKATKEWAEIGKALKREKKIISVDLKTKSVVVDL